MMARTSQRAVLPWEHIVCTECLGKNPYAIWLVKFGCFEEQNHQQRSPKTTTVVVDTENMKLVSVRDPSTLPPRTTAHSQLEYDCWKALHIIKQQKYVDLLHRLQDTQPVISAEVCKHCLSANSQAVWLSWLTCIEHSHRATLNLVTVVLKKDRIVPVRSDTLHTTLRLCSDPNECGHGELCTLAHSQEELNYWRWTKVCRDVHNLLQKEMDPRMGNMQQRYSYPYGHSTVVRDSLCKQQLSSDNYKGKFHKLIYLENLEHARKMVAECDGDLGISNNTEFGELQDSTEVHIVGMNHISMDYACQKPVPTRADISVCASEAAPSCFVSGEVSRKTDNSLIVKIKIGQLPAKLPVKAHVHFEFPHWKFNRLHSAIDNASDILIRRLTTPQYFPPHFSLQICQFLTVEVDDEFQPNVLNRILKGGFGSPFILLGPFGTGKTQLLLAATLTIATASGRVLVCTHHNRGADTISRKLATEPGYRDLVVRLYPNYSELAKHRDFYSVSVTDKALAKKISTFPILVTTFMTALKLSDYQESLYHFSCIILDEGAQSMEPEALGALLLATQETQIIIAGDDKQVGPGALVLDDMAQKNGLGESIIERLLELYETKIHNKSIRNKSRYSLLANYRCHPSILMLASSLFYDCTLRSCSRSKAHPHTPYPIVFQCSWLEEHVAAVSTAVNEEEAKLVLTKAMELVTTWPQTESGEKPIVAIMAGSDAQVDCLRFEYAKLKNTHSQLPCTIQFCLTYSIQGGEFDAVFLSTHEPTDQEGKPINTVRSISNEYVFNTVITRSRSLIFAVGNPFLLVKMGSHFTINCWSELIKRCITCQSFHLQPNIRTRGKSVERLTKIVLSSNGTTRSKNDSSNRGYRKLIRTHKNERLAENLVKNPEGIIGTKYWFDSDDSDCDDEDLAIGSLELLSHRKGRIISSDPDISGHAISLAEDRRCHFSGQKVKVNRKTKQIVVDIEAIQEVNKKYFGYSFPCRVNENSMIQFYPFNKTIPILNNMPNLTKDFKDGVIIFDLSSIDTYPQVSNFIPKECAVNMVFNVTYLRWRKKFPHPLGIVTAALPCGNSVYAGDYLLKLAHNIPIADNQLYSEIVSAPCDLHHNERFDSVITIDPEGSKDHDDALSCGKIKRISPKMSICEVGVHITDVQKFVPKDSEIDKLAMEKGCSVYSSTAECVSHMLPQQIAQAASILSDRQPRSSFSVVAQVKFLTTNNEVQSIDKVRIIKSQITSKHELTYAEAQMSLFHEEGPLNKKLSILWATVCYLRQKRLQDAAIHLSIDETDQIDHPEAHVLVEELMIWANRTVAKRLFDHFPVILRSQSPPDEQELAKLVDAHGQKMAVSLDLKQYLPSGQTCQTVQLLNLTIKEIIAALREGSLRKGLHLVQFEHLQPQVAVAHALFNMIRERSMYRTAQQGDSPDSYSHSSLHCSHYTHFTSPIRRYIDLVVQRMLVAELNEDDCPYQLEELQQIAMNMGDKFREADNYEKDRKSLDMALELQQSSREFLCFVTRAIGGELRWTFRDITLKPARRFINSVQLKHLNAVNISHRDSSPEPESDIPTPQASSNCTWKVKITSLKGTLKSFLANGQFQPQTDCSDSPITISIFTGDEEVLTENTDLRELTLQAAITPVTKEIPMDKWRQLLRYALSPTSADPMSIKDIVSSSQSHQRCEFPTIPQSPLWIYTLHRPLTSCEVLNVQLTGCFNTTAQMVCPTVQLLEVGPGLRVCIQHNSSPSECFTDTSLTKLPLQGHSSIEQYFHFWERALLAEAATASILDTELLIITDVEIVWPELKQVASSQGHMFFQLPERQGNRREDSCACIKVEESCAVSFDLMQISAGDLMCVRCFSEDGIRGVLHMVVDSVSKDHTCVYLKFVGAKPNYISPVMMEALEKMSYEVQLIPLTLPYRRIYNSLRKLHDSSPVSHHIVTTATHPYIPREDLNLEREGNLSASEARVARAIWSTETPGVKLNEYQLKAVQLACYSKLNFIMIRGPPGTGKSMTGAHIAYALAVKLKRERNKAKKNDKDSLNPCVMYCGPSQQSVNVVLDILTSSVEVQQSGVKIVRVYSNAIETKDYQGPKYNSLVFTPVKVDGECREKFQGYALHHLIREANPEIKKFDRTFNELKVKNYIPSSKRRQEYKSLVTKSSIAVLKDNVDIVLCTCNEAGSYRIKESVLPEYCVIDECAMATEPESMVAIRRANKVILIGDDKQLQPVLRSADAIRMGMNRSLFERYAGSEHTHLHELRIQYRMHKALCEFPSNEFYHGKLETDPSVAMRHSATLDRLAEFWPQGRDCPMMLVDVVGEEEENHTGHRGSARVGLESKRNTDEARIIARLAQRLVDHYEVKTDEIAAIAPYSAQKEEIKKELDKCNAREVAVKTITDAQGSEFGIVLLSTVRSQPVRKLPTSRRRDSRNVDVGWKRENLGFITDRHQICVGITRCKYGLIIVGNKQLLAFDQTWASLIRHFEQRNCVHDESVLQDKVYL